MEAPQYDQFGLPVFGGFDLPVPEPAADPELDQAIAEILEGKIDGSIDIVMTPTQMAAVFEHETLENDQPRLTTRLLGGLRGLGCVLEGGTAIGLGLVPEPTFATKLG